MVKKIKSIPLKFKVTIAISIAFVTAIIGHNYIKDFRATNAAARARCVKNDNELLGQRFVVPRENKDGVKVNIYMPENSSNEKLPVIFNIHGGGFVGGDVDMLDTQSNRMANNWNSIIVSINYTKPDVKLLAYGVDEIVDTVLYFNEHAEEYNGDTKKFSVIGYSAGAYYAAKAAIDLDSQGFQLASQILCCPWTKWLPKKVSSSLAPALFILGTEDPISKASEDYQKLLKKLGVNIETKEYNGGFHPFMDTINPEFRLGLTKEQATEFITDEQQALAVQSEKDIHEWLCKLYESHNNK